MNFTFILIDVLASESAQFNVYRRCLILQYIVLQQREDKNMIILEATNDKIKFNNIKEFRACLAENIIILHNTKSLVKYEFLYGNLVKKRFIVHK